MSLMDKIYNWFFEVKREIPEPLPVYISCSELFLKREEVKETENA